MLYQAYIDENIRGVELELESLAVRSLPFEEICLYAAAHY